MCAFSSGVFLHLGRKYSTKYLWGFLSSPNTNMALDTAPELCGAQDGGYVHLLREFLFLLVWNIAIVYRHRHCTRKYLGSRLVKCASSSGGFPQLNKKYCKTLFQRWVLRSIRNNVTFASSSKVPGAQVRGYQHHLQVILFILVQNIAQIIFLSLLGRRTRL